MRKVYLDNAATTPLRPEVIVEMALSLERDFGNPSSTHMFGRQAKSAVELARKSIAKNLNCTAQEIIFTSGATEATNWIFRNAIKALGVTRIITSRIEHHAVLHTVSAMEQEYGTTVDYVKIKATGEIDLSHLTELLSVEGKTLVSLMHVNNEIGTVLDLELTGRICKQHGALFHSDTVQSIGKASFDLQKIPIDFIVASAHKFHGPKGVGFLFIRKGVLMNPLIFGGEQEKGLRAGTEAVHNIAGMAKALDIAYEHWDHERDYIMNLRNYTASELRRYFPDVKINGNEQTGFYNLLNACLPFSEDKTSMILFHLDMKGIAVSRGSACQSGSAKPSHVLAEVLQADDLKKPSLRISFSHFNTTEDIDLLIEALRTL
ncbi:MAG TPA: cysteine desulfurase family protein [Flavobacterium sp.]|nr:cysteine desulfurase family protein [Flavobacterium sp.]